VSNTTDGNGGLQLTVHSNSNQC